jgi:predicted nucleic-acid-binding protein
MPRSLRAAIAVDTNVVVRLLTADDAEQAERAKGLFERETIWLPKTVILETEWVLRRLYRFSRSRVARALTALVALPNVRCEDEAALLSALGWALDGLDFADALHLASAGPAQEFATFDADLVKDAAAVATGIAVKVL